MRFVALSSIVVIASCKVGTPADGPGGDGDAAVDAFDQTACVERLTPADPAHIHSDDNTTKAGTSCGVGGCHALTEANPWLFSGTVYSNLTGTTVEAGVLVRVRTSDPMRPLRAVTDSAGNFHVQNLPGSGTQALLTFPTRVEVTACPDVTPMVMEVEDESGLNCAKGGCHDANQRIRLKL